MFGQVECGYLISFFFSFFVSQSFALKGLAERKVNFSLEEKDEHEIENEDLDKKHPLKLHRR